MRLVHFADCHLGHARYARTTKTGQNLRQHDIEVAFCAMIDAVIACAPDLVLVGGDLFDVPRPNNRTITVAMQEFGRLTRVLPDCCVVIVAGNHDTPRADEQGHLFRLLATLPLHVIDAGCARIDRDGVSIVGVPDTPVAQRELADLKARGMAIRDLANAAAMTNLLVMHGEIEGMLPRAAHLPATAHRSELERPLEEIGPDGWAYVALGHWHVYREMAPRTFYAGSLGYTSSDPWSEMRQERALGIAGKGFIEHDLATGAQVFHPLPCDRRHVEIPAVSALGMTSADVNAAIADAIAAVDGGIEGAVVRLQVTECAKPTAEALDQKLLKSIRLRALHFSLDVRRPEVTRVVVSGGVQRSQSLERRIGEFLRDRVDVPDINKHDLAALAGSYLAKTTGRGDEDFALAEMLDASVPAIAETAEQAA